MALNLKVMFLGLALLTGNVMAQTLSPGQSKYLTITQMKTSEVSRDFLNQEVLDTLYRRNIDIEGLPSQIGNAEPIQQAGKVVKIARDLIALGEDIYRLVIKGKPSNTTKYAPISVIPKINGAPVDILETEMWNVPVKRTFEVRWENAYGVDVVTFRYSVIFAYGGSYNGKGAYLTAVQIIPESVNTLFGFDFTATMKLGGIQNNGTRENPIAGATLLMEYTVNSMVKANTNVATFFVTGKGDFKKY